MEAHLRDIYLYEILPASSGTLSLGALKEPTTEPPSEAPEHSNRFVRS